MSGRILFIGLLWLCACSAPPGKPDSADGTPISPSRPAAAEHLTAPTGRLPATVVPLAYGLDLTIVPRRESFSGYATIDIDIRERLDGFFLHASELQVSEVILRLESGSALEAEFESTAAPGVARVVLPQSVAPQTARLQISYEAPFGSRLKGLYRVEDGGEFYAYTQFEPISARQAFPCFDEPVFKTPFNISLAVQRGHEAIANMPERERIPLENGLVRISFAPTPPLPTYLIAFAVGPLDVVSAPDIPATPLRPEPLPLRGTSSRGKSDKLGHALGTTPGLLIVLEDYFGMAHPYPKLDILAVPEFAAGAMENVGAITYREGLLLLADDAPVLQRRRHALVHAHELAHMWFGNLVTMPWWDDIWLKEAFATWLSYKAVAEWKPQHRAELSRLSRLSRAMDEDALSTARQIRQPVESSHDIENAFDGITYSKGGAVLGMFERFMGPERFREAIRYHIRRFQHASADVDDFIESIAHVGGKAIGEAFRSFLFQPGIPLVDVTLDCSATEPAVVLQQSRFRPIGSESEASPQGWTIPVCMRYGDDTVQRETCSLAGPDITTVALEMDRCPSWLLPNAGSAGYFHWVLPPAGYAGALAAGQQLTALEQMSIADSIYAALASGRMSVSEGASLLEALARSDRPQVALAPKRFIEHTADYLVERHSTRDGLNAFVQRLYGDLPAQQAFDPDFMTRLPSDSRRLFLVEVAELRARSGDGIVRGEAVRRAAEWIAGRSGQLSPSSVRLALQLAVEDTGEAAFRPLLARLRASRDGRERSVILLALARTTDPRLAAEVRSLALSKNIRVNEIRSFLHAHSRQPDNRPATQAWLKENFHAVVSRVPPHDAGHLVAELTAGLCDEASAEQVQRYFGPRMTELAGGPRNLARTVEKIRLCARRAAIQRSQADDYF